MRKQLFDSLQSSQEQKVQIGENHSQSKDNFNISGSNLLDCNISSE